MPSVLLTAGLGIVLVILALLTVSVRNLVHSVLLLGVVLAGTAVLFVALGAAFLATVQVLLYIGGVVTLLVFGVMLTSRPAGTTVIRDLRGRLRAGLVAAALFGVMCLAILKTPGLDAEPAAPASATSELAGTLLGKDLLAFEVLSLLLLAAMIGAAVLARPRDFGAPKRKAGEAAVATVGETESRPYGSPS